MTYTLKFTIAELPKPINRLGGKHWAQMKRYRDYWHQLVAAAVCGKKPREPLRRAKLTLVRYSSVAPDFDNLAGSWKPVIDGLQYCGVIENDSMAHIGVPVMQWEKAPPKQGRIFVAVEEIGETHETADIG